MRRVFKRALVIGADIILFLFFGLGILDAIFNQDPIWLLLTYIAGTLISLLILIVWLLKRWRDKVWFWRVNLIWTIGWGLYFLFIVITVVIAINQLSSLG